MSKKKKNTAKKKTKKPKKNEERKKNSTKEVASKEKSKKENRDIEEKSSEEKSVKKSEGSKKEAEGGKDKPSVTISKPDMDNLGQELKKFYKFLKEKHILSNIAWILAFLISLIVMDYAFQYWNNDLSVAIVGGRRISRNDYMKRTQQIAGLQAVEELVNEELVKHKAQKEGVEVSDKEVEEIIDQDVKSVGGEEELRKLINDYPAMNMETYREEIRITLLKLKLFKKYIDVTDEELKQFFDANKQYLFPEQEDVKFENKKEEVEEIYLDYKFKNDMQARNEWYNTLKEEFTVQNNFTDEVDYGFMKATRDAYKLFLGQVTTEDEQEEANKNEKTTEKEDAEKSESGK